MLIIAYLSGGPDTPDSCVLDWMSLPWMVGLVKSGVSVSMGSVIAGAAGKDDPA